MNIKTSAHYQREYRKRLRDQGLVKREIWIRPEHAERARAMEKVLRSAPTFDGVSGEASSQSPLAWTTDTLFSALQQTALVTGQRATIELIEGVDPTVLLVMQEFGDLPVYLNVAGEQLIVESVLWPLTDVVDVVAFDQVVLRTHQYFPLSTICVDQRAGEEYYLMFGSLGSSVEVSAIEQEIDMLASNVIAVTEAYAEYLHDVEVNDASALGGSRP